MPHCDLHTICQSIEYCTVWGRAGGLSRLGTPPKRCIGASPFRRISKDYGTAGARTQDQRLKRALLYQLSYRPRKGARIIHYGRWTGSRIARVVPERGSTGRSLPRRLRSTLPRGLALRCVRRYPFQPLTRQSRGVAVRIFLGYFLKGLARIGVPLQLVLGVSKFEHRVGRLA
jgi:hypothetical protein